MSSGKWSATGISFKWVCSQSPPTERQCTSAMCDWSLHVNDNAIYYSSRGSVTIERRIQGAINRLSRGMDFRFPQLKPTVYI